MRPGRRSLVALAVILAAAMVLAAVQLALPGGRAATRCERLLAAGGPTGQRIGPTGPTVGEPLGATRMTMDAARSAFGVSVPLPDTAAVRPADVGAVWEETLSGVKSTKVTFPAQGLMIFYRRPAIHPQPTTTLNGTTPALVIAENSDDTCANFGVVAFVVKGTEVEVMAHKHAPTLEAIAQSILARWPRLIK